MDETVREDLGYRRERMTGKQNRREPIEKIRIRYLRGQLTDRIVVMKTTIAEDLITRGFAEEILEREAGEEG